MASLIYFLPYIWYHKKIHRRWEPKEILMKLIRKHRMQLRDLISNFLFLLTRCFRSLQYKITCPSYPVVIVVNVLCTSNAKKKTFQVVLNQKIEFFCYFFFKLKKTAKTTQKRSFRTLFLPQISTSHKTKWRRASERKRVVDEH